jgi:hypothetical protein
VYLYFNSYVLMDCNSAVVCSIVVCDLHPCHEIELRSLWDTNKGVSTDVDEKTGRDGKEYAIQTKKQNYDIVYASKSE